MTLTRRLLVFFAVCFGLGVYAGMAEGATWHGHTVKARFDGQIDASPCSESSCLRGLVGIYVDGVDVRDHVVQCPWPHPRILDFSRRGYPHRHYAKVHACGKNHWWRFR